LSNSNSEARAHKHTRSLFLAFLDYAEEVTIRVFQHTEIIIWVIPLTMTLRSDFEQSVHFGFSVVGAEVKMQSISASPFGGNFVQRYVRTSFSFRITKNDPASLRRPKPKNTRLSVFKGREAKLNRAIFRTLALKGAQTIYDIHKEVRTFKGLKYTYYGNVNKRVRALQKLGYVKEVNIKSTKAGFEANEYEVTTRAYLALLLDSINLEEVLNRTDEDVASNILVAIAAAT
jgi:hypothetical protein